MIPASRSSFVPPRRCARFRILSGDACRSKSKNEAQQKAPSFIHAYGWKMELFAFSEPGTNCGMSNLDIHWLRNPKGSNGNRLFPWHTILLARSSVLYLLRPWVPEGRPLAGCGIAYRAAGSGRDRPAHRQRPAAVRKRLERNLRAVISEKVLSRPGRRRYIKPPSSPVASKHVFQ